MFFAVVETSLGDRLNVQHPDGRIGGNLILSFWLGVRDYCSGSKMPDMELFKKLEVYGKVSLCTLVQPLSQSLYEDDESELYTAHPPKTRLTEEEPKAKKKGTEENWGDLQRLLETVRILIQLLREVDGETNSWYVPIQTVADFEALLHTLNLLNERKVGAVRIKFI